MRLAYFSADRNKLRFAGAGFSGAMAKVTTATVEALKKCIRFLLKYPRCIQCFEKQEIVLKHFLKFTSTTQAVVSVSTTQHSRQQLRELLAFQWCENLEWFATTTRSQSQSERKVMKLTVKFRNKIGRNGRKSHCKAKRWWTHTSQSRRCGRNASLSMETSRWRELVDITIVHLNYQTMNKHLMFFGMRVAKGWSKNCTSRWNSFQHPFMWARRRVKGHTLLFQGMRKNFCWVLKT